MSFTVDFSDRSVDYLFEDGIAFLNQLSERKKIIVVTDQHVHDCFPEWFRQLETIILPPGEDQKNLDTISYLTQQLLDKKADRHCFLLGVGGGVITDITGFLASIYMRGVDFGFFPTSVLAMVDAAVGGKNGVNFGAYKNILGTIRQPSFVLFDLIFLSTLPDEEWSNGFAEVIKYGCVYDNFLFEELLDRYLHYYQTDKDALQRLIQRCVKIKNKAVLTDEHDHGTRRLLNFGHTVGHALEKQLKLKHGYSVAAGMMIACKISEKINGLLPEITDALQRLLVRYHLPFKVDLDPEQTFQLLQMDKKRRGKDIDFIVLEKIGSGKVQSVPLSIIEETLLEYNCADRR